MIAGINESKTLAKHISCECKCIFDGRNCYSEQQQNNHKGRCECKKSHACKKYYIWNPATCCYKNGKYLASFMDDALVICDEDIEFDDKIKTVPTNVNEDVKSFCFTWIL